MADWPSTLTQEVFADENPPTYNAQSNVVRTDMTTGPAKMRRRFTAVPADVTAQVMMTEAEIAILENFVKVTLGEVSQFNWINFHTRQPASYRFKNGWNSVKLTWVGDDIWSVAMELEQMP